MEVDKILDNQDTNMEINKILDNQVTITILELQDNSMFMGDSMSNIIVRKFYDKLWEITEQLIYKGIPGETCMVIRGTQGTSKSVMRQYL